MEDILRLYREEFIEGMQQEIAAVSQYARTDNPSIGALLLAKAGVAETRRIKMEYHIEGELKNIPMPSWEITRVLGNLINNAMDAVAEQPLKKRKIMVNLFQNASGFLFQVCNEGQPIPPQLWEQIFKPGFTTKGSKGSGMGLYIVRSLVNKYGGTVDVISSEEEGTVFNVILPMND